MLKDVSFTAKQGEVTALVGPSGGGKTTMVNLLPRFYDVTSGSVCIDGVDVRDLELDSLRDKIAIVFQDNFLFAGTIRENILLGKEDATPEEIDRAVKSACLEEFIASLDKGLDTEIGERGVLLSGGQKQRIAIAGVLAMKPQCIVLDEPTAMLDPVGRRDVMETSERLNREEGITMILITHYMDEAVRADKVFVIDDGDLVMQGTPKEIFSQVETLQKYGLDVPQVTEVAYLLRKEGIDLPADILTIEEMVGAICQLKSTT